MLKRRIEKLEQCFVKPERFILHTVSWDGPDDDKRGGPIGYLLDGKIYPNDDNLVEAIRRDYPPSKGKTTHRVLWEPIYKPKD